MLYKKCVYKKMLSVGDFIMWACFRTFSAVDTWPWTPTHKATFLEWKS